MNQTNKSKITQKLGESFQQHLEAYETELAMGNLSIAQVMKTQSMHLKILEALQKKGPEIIELNENDESMNPVMPIMRAITSTVNLGQTCYANAVVFYSLRFIPLFTEKLHKWVKKSVGNMPRKGKQVLEIFQVLHAEYIAMAGSERRDDLWSQFEEAVECAHDTSMFLCVLRELAPQFVKNEPNDSAALLIKMLEWLKYCSDILRAENGLAADIEEACFYDDYFMGKELKTIKCLGCGHIKAGPVLETSIILVPIPRGMEDMNDYDWIIESLSRSDERNEYNCENCQAQPQPNAEINTSYELLPRLLILQLQFSIKDLAPLPLELQCFCVECKDGQPNANHKYHLNSIVVHSGFSSEGGHYFAFVRHLNTGGNNEHCCRIRMNTGVIRGKNLRETWLKCDDTKISVISKDDMDNILRNVALKPHLVFYARNDIVTQVRNN